MKRRAAAGCLVGLLVLGSAGCSSDDQQADTPGASAEAQSPEPPASPPPAKAAAVEAPPANLTEAQAVALAKQHRCEDGRTVEQVIDYARTATGGSFHPKGFDGFYTQAGALSSVGVTYTIGRQTKDGDERSFGWRLTAKGVVPDSPDAHLIELGAKPFAYAMNCFLEQEQEPFSRQLRHDFSFLAVIPVKSYPGGLADAASALGLQLTEASIDYLPRADGGYVVEVFFTYRGEPDLHARWERAPGSKDFEPGNGWARAIAKGDTTGA